MYFLGVESAESETRAIVVDLETATVVASASSPHTLVEGVPIGSQEQDPSLWIAALDQTVKECLNTLGADRDQVVAMSVGAQSKGLVLLDENNAIVRPAKIEGDTSAVKQLHALNRNFGGAPGLSELIGNRIEVDSFVTKLLWVKERELSNFQRTTSVMQPREFINYWLTGVKKTEAGDASRTGLFDVPNRKWSQPVVDFIDPHLSEKLSPISGPEKLLGPLRAEIAQSWGLKRELLVGIGSGRSMMRALGSGTVDPSTAVLDFGTSGTVWGVSKSAQVDPRGEVDLWCDATDQWLSHFTEERAVASMEMVRNHYGWSGLEMEQAASHAAIGSGGLMALPLGHGTSSEKGEGMFHGITALNFTQSNVARATLEGIASGLAFGYHRMVELDHDFKNIRVTGRGVGSQFWRQLIADVTGVPSCTLVTHEGAALGAAIHAAVTYFQQGGEDLTFAEMADYSVLVDDDSWCEPNEDNHDYYLEQLSKQQYLAETLIGAGFLV
jgi:xylulokinase